MLLRVDEPKSGNYQIYIDTKLEWIFPKERQQQVKQKTFVRNFAASTHKNKFWVNLRKEIYKIHYKIHS